MYTGHFIVRLRSCTRYLFFFLIISCFFALIISSFLLCSFTFLFLVRFFLSSFLPCFLLSSVGVWGRVALFTSLVQASNAYLDGLSAWRLGHQLSACSVQWGPVAEVGMASKDRSGQMGGSRFLVFSHYHRDLGGARLFFLSISTKIDPFKGCWVVFLLASLYVHPKLVLKWQARGSEPVASRGWNKVRVALLLG